MAFTELNSFIHKFNQLWHSGKSAHLDIDTHAGEAWVGLRVRLGHAPHQKVFHDLSRNKVTSDSPSRQRRRAKRAAERELVNVEQTVVVAAEEAVNTEAVEIIADNPPNEEIHSEDKEEHVEKPLSEEFVTEVVASNEVTAQVEDETAEEVEIIGNKEVEISDAKIETVFAVAHFENLPFNTLTEDDLKSLEKFVLEENIVAFDFKVISSLEVNLQFSLKTDSLWESPRQYLWKHLGGNNYWDRSNGTRIRIKRIHAAQ